MHLIYHLQTVGRILKQFCCANISWNYLDFW